ncbi:Uncharacterised protein [Mycobacteroides abscessus subsp. abscessus]|nr:Uncharacterised protein [Mycobacteroides abscessus subsp. abscessus]
MILVPAATNIVGAFQQHDVSDTRLQQLDPGCNAAGPGADDGDLEFWLFAAHFATRFSKGCRSTGSCLPVRATAAGHPR